MHKITTLKCKYNWVYYLFKAEWVPFVRWQRNGRNISYEANHFQQMMVIKEPLFGFLCFTCSRKWLQKPRFLKVERNGLIGWRRHLSSELLIASHCCLFCSFIFKTSLVFQPQSRVVLNCAGPRVSTYSEVQECLQTESPRVPTQWSPRVPTQSSSRVPTYSQAHRLRTEDNWVPVSIL